MSWHVTMLFVHIAALGALAAIYRHCPDWIQRGVIWLLVVAGVVFLAADAALIAGSPLRWEFTRLAYELEHLAMLLYVFRLFIVDQERRCLPKQSVPSRSSPG